MISKKVLKILSLQPYTVFQIPANVVAATSTNYT